MDSFCEMIQIANELEEMKAERCKQLKAINSQNPNYRKDILDEELV